MSPILPAKVYSRKLFLNLTIKRLQYIFSQSVLDVLVEFIKDFIRSKIVVLIADTPDTVSFIGEPGYKGSGTIVLFSYQLYTDSVIRQYHDVQNLIGIAIIGMPAMIITGIIQLFECKVLTFHLSASSIDRLSSIT